MIIESSAPDGCRRNDRAYIPEWQCSANRRRTQRGNRSRTYDKTGTMGAGLTFVVDDAGNTVVDDAGNIVVKT